MGYTVSNSGLTERYVDGNCEWLADSVMGFEVVEKKKCDTTANAIGENIDAHVIFRLHTISIPNGIRYKYNLVTTIKGWNKSAKTMKVEHYVQEWCDLKL